MHRFYCPDLAMSVPGDAAAGALVDLPLVDLPDEESTHARRVLRVREGEMVGLLDGAGLTAEAEVVAVGKPVTVRVTQAARHEPVRPELDVAAAVPKGALVEEMVRQLSQLGATRLIPLSTGRSVVDPRQSKLDRLQRLAVESAKQCGRAHLLQIDPVAPFAEALQASYDVALIAALGDTDEVTPELLRNRLRSSERVLVLIGPEGGWTPDELATARDTGALPWRLGPHVMRIEAAACAAAAILRYLALDNAPHA